MQIAQITPVTPYSITHTHIHIHIYIYILWVAVGSRFAQPYLAQHCLGSSACSRPCLPLVCPGTPGHPDVVSFLSILMSLVRARRDHEYAGCKDQNIFKRQRLVGKAQAIPLRQLAALTIAANDLEDLPDNPEDYESKLRSHSYCLGKELSETANRSTPYGQLLDKMTIEVEGAPFVWWYVNPFALLYSFCELSAVFCSLLRAAGTSAGGLIRICLYTDEMTPGNNLRCDQGRRIQCIYWNCMDFPDYVRSRDAGWFLFGALQTKHVEHIGGGLSAVISHVVNVFFGGTFNFAITGMTFPGTDGGGEFHFFGALSAQVQDEKAHKETGSLKGASGWKCCGKCSNVMNTEEDISGNPNLVDYKTASLDQCRQHTDESFYAMADDLQAKHGVIAPKQFEDLQKAYGLKYEPAGLLFNLRLRRYYRPHSILVYDWMHNLLTSSGVGQYQCNAFVRCVLELGTTLKELDDLAQTVVWPAETTRLSKTFFRDRYSKKAGGCLKGFAGDCMVAVQLLSWYAFTVLQPEGLMSEECVCMHLLAKIIEIYRRRFFYYVPLLW